MKDGVPEMSGPAHASFPGLHGDARANAYIFVYIYFYNRKIQAFFLHKNTETSSRRIITLKEFTVGLKQIYNMQHFELSHDTLNVELFLTLKRRHTCSS